MMKYGKIINEENGLCEVGTGNNPKIYKNIGYSLLDVQQSDIDNQWYLAEKCPMKTEDVKLLEAKEIKAQEATTKAYAYEQTDALITVKATNAMTRVSDLYHIEGHFTNMIKISAYAQSMAAEDVLPWNTKENVNVFLNKTGCAQLSALMQQMNVKLWTVDFPTYLAQIEACTTVEEVNAINIEYANPEEVIDLTEQVNENKAD